MYTTTDRNAIRYPIDGMEVFETNTNSKYIYRNGSWILDVASQNVSPDYFISIPSTRLNDILKRIDISLLVELLIEEKNEINRYENLGLGTCYEATVVRDIILGIIKSQMKDGQLPKNLKDEIKLDLLLELGE